jgi:hypothetical protein
MAARILHSCAPCLKKQSEAGAAQAAPQHHLGACICNGSTHVLATPNTGNALAHLAAPHACQMHQWLVTDVPEGAVLGSAPRCKGQASAQLQPTPVQLDPCPLLSSKVVRIPNFKLQRLLTPSAVPLPTATRGSAWSSGEADSMRQHLTGIVLETVLRMHMARTHQMRRGLRADVFQVPLHSETGSQRQFEGM